MFDYREGLSSEERAASWYVLKRPLERPNTSYMRCLLYVLFFFIINAVILFAWIWLFKVLSSSHFMDESLFRYCKLHKAGFTLLLVICQLVVSGLIVCKRALIGIIHLYQRYSPEDVRRRCQFMPSCSAYAILSIKKYGVIVGLIKTRDRFKRCRGHIYRIDYP